MSRRILLVHGWNIRDRGERTMGGIRDELAARGFDVVLLSPGHLRGWRETRHRSRQLAKTWAVQTKPGDVLVGHSNGCRIAWEMSQHPGCLADLAVWIQPALDGYLLPGRCIRRCLVLWNRNDRVVWWARLLPWSDWGDMGRRGPVPIEGGLGRDRRLLAVEMGRGHSPQVEAPQDYADEVERFVERFAAPRCS